MTTGASPNEDGPKLHPPFHRMEEKGRGERRPVGWDFPSSRSSPRLFLAGRDHPRLRARKATLNPPLPLPGGEGTKLPSWEG